VKTALGARLKIRAMVHVAGEAIPYFWPMRTFIHHNPLHGLEHLSFHEAVLEGGRLFHGRGYLPRAMYQRYLEEGKIDLDLLDAQIGEFLDRRTPVEGLDTRKLLLTLATNFSEPLAPQDAIAGAQDIHAVLKSVSMPQANLDAEWLKSRLNAKISSARPAHAVVDELFGAEIGSDLNELLIKSCLDFFDEGQSVWQMPGRDKGLFSAWSALARRNLRLFIRGLHIKNILDADDTPEGVISHVMSELGIPEDDWLDCFTSELTCLHGWAGFIRWRSGAKNYHWSRSYPADLVDYLAIRLVLGLALLREHAHRKGTPASLADIARLVDEHPEEVFLRQEFYSGKVLPELAREVEEAISSRRGQSRLFQKYLERKREMEARSVAAAVRQLADASETARQVEELAPEAFGQFMDLLADFEQEEGRMWLDAQEACYMKHLLSGLNRDDPLKREKRPFAQALFCIDVRSERIRRHLEKVGEYQTYGIAGFFGIPVGFIGLEKGSETHLCPVVVSPKNLVLELAIARSQGEQDLVSVLEHVVHELKASIVSPFITVEAIGLLFGLDMFGKSLAPLTYNRWRQRLHAEKTDSRLLLDKLSREQAESIIRSLQRAMIVKAVGRDLGIQREAITDEMIRELRDAALENHTGRTLLARQFDLTEQAERNFLDRLQRVYRINRGYAQIQLERLGRIGFSLDEQVNFVSQALHSIGLTRDFSRFVLLAGHGSTSENNPYESALDCGACGGNHGIINARVLSQIANKPAVRERLRAQGIDIADDTWFVPAFHNTTTDELALHDLDLLPPSHLVYLERLNNGLRAASRLCAAERLRTLEESNHAEPPAKAYRHAQRNAMDWSQVRPEWGLSRNAAFLIGRRNLTERLDLEGRVFLHSYDYRCDPKGRLLENILTGPLVVGQWINMEHYFSTVDNDHYGSGSKVYHNVAGRFGVMTGNLSDLRTGLPSQTVLRNGLPYHEPMRLLTVIEAPLQLARQAIEGVAKVKHLVQNGWVRMAICDPESRVFHLFRDGTWQPLYELDSVIESKEINA
jgi:uncharacterized protein YbcC (UPF0753/DUF2309 family)